MPFAPPTPSRPTYNPWRHSRHHVSTSDLSRLFRYHSMLKQYLLESSQHDPWSSEHYPVRTLAGNWSSRASNARDTISSSLPFEPLPELTEGSSVSEAEGNTCPEPRGSTCKKVRVFDSDYPLWTREFGEGFQRDILCGIGGIFEPPKLLPVAGRKEYNPKSQISPPVTAQPVSVVSEIAGVVVVNPVLQEKLHRLYDLFPTILAPYVHNHGGQGDRDRSRHTESSKQSDRGGSGSQNSVNSNKFSAHSGFAQLKGDDGNKGDGDKDRERPRAGGAVDRYHEGSTDLEFVCVVRACQPELAEAARCIFRHKDIGEIYRHMKRVHHDQYDQFEPSLWTLIEQKHSDRDLRKKPILLWKAWYEACLPGRDIEESCWYYRPRPISERVRLGASLPFPPEPLGSSQPTRLSANSTVRGHFRERSEDVQQIVDNNAIQEVRQDTSEVDELGIDLDTYLDEVQVSMSERDTYLAQGRKEFQKRIALCNQQPEPIARCNRKRAISELLSYAEQAHDTYAKKKAKIARRLEGDLVQSTLLRQHIEDKTSSEEGTCREEGTGIPPNNFDTELQITNLPDTLTYIQDDERLPYEDSCPNCWIGETGNELCSRHLDEVLAGVGKGRYAIP